MGKWSASYPGKELQLSTAKEGGREGVWVSPKDCLDTLEKRNISCPCRKSNHDSFVIQPTN